MTEAVNETIQRPVKVLAISSGGGHWEELVLLRPALEQFDVEFATTDEDLAVRDGLGRIHLIADSNRDRPLQALRTVTDAWRIVRAVRPDVVVTTGALPGLFALIIARLHGARTIWIDSIANSDKPSMSGNCARFFATAWLTQWEHLARPNGPLYRGALL